MDIGTDSHPGVSPYRGLRARTALLLGEAACGRLARSAVLVAGLGGVGSFTVEALARAGVGRLVLVDDDVVEESNLNRQLVGALSTVGRPKVEVAAGRVADINPGARIVKIRGRITAANAQDIVALLVEQAAVQERACVADCVDDVAAKVGLALACRSVNVPIVAAMGAARRLDPTAFRVADVSDTRSCPLARAYRRELRAHGVTEGVTVVFSEETPCGEAGGTVAWATGACGLAVAWACARALIAPAAG